MELKVIKGGRTTKFKTSPPQGNLKLVSNSVNREAMLGGNTTLFLENMAATYRTFDPHPVLTKIKKIRRKGES